MLNLRNGDVQWPRAFGLWVLSLMLSFMFSAKGQDNAPRVLDEIVAKINDEIITLTDLNRELRQLKNQLSQEIDDPQTLENEFEKRKPFLLKNMIQNKIMMQRAEEMGISSDIDVQVATYMEEMRKEAGIPNFEVLDQYLKQQGSSLKEYQDRVKEQMITRSMIQHFVYSKITLLTPEVEAYYEEHQDDFAVPAQVTLAEILFLKEGKERDEVKARAEKAFQELEKGNSFEEVAREYSEGPTAESGGEIGTFRRGSMNEALESVVFDAEVGGHTGVIETDYGFQIVKILDKKPPQVKPLQEVRPQITEVLYQEKAEPELKEFLERLVDESYIFVTPKYAEEFRVDDLTS